jgi:hypothetical protein
MLFGTKEITCTRNAFQDAEKLTGRYFGLVSDAWKIHRYDVRTLAELREHEVNESAFAHLCKYHYRVRDPRIYWNGVDFYRICIQDNRILDALKRGSSFIRLVPLMLYIATHELIHVLRFERGESSFEMPVEERKREEERVHHIARQVLKPAASSELDLVLECFDDDRLIGKFSN